MNWDIVIGLEIHVQLNTKSKLFSSTPTDFISDPNINVGVVEMALPGSLPVLNKEVVNKAIKLGIALKATINQKNVFDRKNYFYPDLPKAYQISQLAFPIIEFGKLHIHDKEIDKIINVTRAHIEEDAGKSIHDILPQETAIDLNRSGIPLIEVVSEPELSSSKEAVLYAKTLHNLVMWLDICDGNMAEGSFRVDANVSVKRKNTDILGTRCEIKNLNSFKFLEQAINYEISRQIEVLEDGGKIIQQTRLFDTKTGMTQSMRSKEDAHDYRYFPEPDLYPVIITDEHLESIKNKIPELPDDMANRLTKEYNLSVYDVNLVTSDKHKADYFNELIKHNIDAKIAVNWINGELAKLLNKNNLTIDKSLINPSNLAKLLAKLQNKTISNQASKKILDLMWDNPKLSIDEIIKNNGFEQIADFNQIGNIVDDVIKKNQRSVNEFKSGKEKALNALVGQVMKLTRGQADPITVQQLIKDKLK